MDINLYIQNIINETYKSNLINFDTPGFEKSKIESAETIHQKIVDNIIDKILTIDLYKVDDSEYNVLTTQKYTVKTEDDLKKIIASVINGAGGPSADLNWIDISNIFVLNLIFKYVDTSNIYNLNPDISKWDTRHITSMSYIFYHTGFYGDISNWDFSSCENISYMFASYCGSFECFQVLLSNLNKISIDDNHISPNINIDYFMHIDKRNKTYTIRRPKFIIELEKISKEKRKKEKELGDNIMLPYIDLLIDKMDDNILLYYNIRLSKTTSSIKIENNFTECTIIRYEDNDWKYSIYSRFKFKRSNGTYILDGIANNIVKGSHPLRDIRDILSFDELICKISKDPYFVYWKFI